MNETERERLIALPFRMVIRDVRFIPTNGVVIIGHVEEGRLHVRDTICIAGDQTTLVTRAKAFDMWHKITDVIELGDEVAILLPRDVQPEQIQADMVVTRQDER